MLTLAFTAYSQSSSMIISGRNYVHSQRPRFIPFLLDSTVSFYKTSVDSLFIRPVQVIGLKDVATTASYNDLLNKPDLSDFLIKSDTSILARKSSLFLYLKYSDTSSMLLPYAKKNDIPKNTSQLINNSGFLTSYTESDPTVPSYAKTLSGFNSIKTDTDLLYRSISWVPNWSDIVSKPIFSTVSISGDYNDLLNKPTIPSVVQQFGTYYTKEFNSKVSTTVSSNEYTFNISAAGFTNINNIQATGYYNGATSVTQPIVSVKSYSNSSVTVVVAESANTNVLIGGVVEGLTDFLKVGEIFLSVKGN